MRRKILPFALLLSFGPLVSCVDDLPTGTNGARPAPRFALVAGPYTPLNVGSVTASVVTIDNQTGTQSDADVSGDLACYQDSDLGIVRYYRFSNASNTPISTTGVDSQCGIDAGRIVLMRYNDPQFAIHVFDVATSTLTELAPNPGAIRRDGVIGGDAAAFFEDVYSAPQTFTTALHAVNLAAPGQSQVVSSSGIAEDMPAISPDGNVIVWRSRDANGDARVMKSVRSGGVWRAPEQVNTTQFCASDLPDTDGSYIVWVSDCDDFDGDIYIQAVSGGAIMQLALAGFDSEPRISSGVITFIHSDDTSVVVGDVMAYNLANDSLLRVTNSATIDDRRARVDVLSGGNIRVVWETLNANDIYGITFTPGGGSPATTPSYTFGGFTSKIKNPPTLNPVKAGTNLAVKFSLGGNQGTAIFASGSPTSTPIDCTSFSPTGPAVPTVSPGGSTVFYDLVSGLYNYNWKIDKNWAANSCRKLTLTFTNGQSAEAYFRIT